MEVFEKYAAYFACLAALRFIKTLPKKITMPSANPAESDALLGENRSSSSKHKNQCPSFLLTICDKPSESAHNPLSLHETALAIMTIKKEIHHAEHAFVKAETKLIAAKKRLQEEEEALKKTHTVRDELEKKSVVGEILERQKRIAELEAQLVEALKSDYVEALNCYTAAESKHPRENTPFFGLLKLGLANLTLLLRFFSTLFYFFSVKSALELIAKSTETPEKDAYYPVFVLSSLLWFGDAYSTIKATKKPVFALAHAGDWFARFKGLLRDLKSGAFPRDAFFAGLVAAVGTAIKGQKGFEGLVAQTLGEDYADTLTPFSYLVGAGSALSFLLFLVGSKAYEAHALQVKFKEMGEAYQLGRKAHAGEIFRVNVMGMLLGILGALFSAIALFCKHGKFDPRQSNPFAITSFVVLSSANFYLCYFYVYNFHFLMQSLLHMHENEVKQLKQSTTDQSCGNLQVRQSLFPACCEIKTKTPNLTWLQKIGKANNVFQGLGNVLNFTFSVMLTINLILSTAKRDVSEGVNLTMLAAAFFISSFNFLRTLATWAGIETKLEPKSRSVATESNISLRTLDRDRDETSSQATLPNTESCASFPDMMMLGA